MHRQLHSFPTRRSSDLVVFIGPYEHHSNELPWREAPVELITIDEDRDGRVDVEHLDYELRRHADSPLKRSEEHTSELQSHVNLVCRLLLEKKNRLLLRH